MKPGKILSLRSLLILVLAVVVISLLVSTAVWAQPSASPAVTPSPAPSASAAAPSPTATPASQEIFGQVESLAPDKTYFVIQKDDQSSVTINVNSNTDYLLVNVPSTILSALTGDMSNMMGLGMFDGDSNNMPGMMDNMPGMMSPTPKMSGMPTATSSMMQPATFDTLTVGDLVMVRGFSARNVARQVIIIRFTGNVKFVQGSVSAVTANSVTIAPTQGSAVTLGWNTDSKFLLEGVIAIQTGQRISAIYDSSGLLFKAALVKPAAGSPTPSATSAASPLPTASVVPSPSASGAPSPLASPTSAPSASPSGANTVNTMTKTGIGTYLVDSKGMSLYFTMKDAVGVSNVTGATLQIWPVFFTQTVTVPASLNASDFGTITRSDGTKQTTFRGYPLYNYANDKAPGDTNGQGIGGVWFVVNPSNFPPTSTPAVSSAASPSATSY